LVYGLETKHNFNKKSRRDDKKSKKNSVKKIKIPRKAKTSRSKRKKGYVGVLFLNEGNIIRGEKTKLDGGTYVLKDGNTRYTNGSEIIWWEGKFPIIYQRYDKANPTKINVEPTLTKLDDGTLVRVNEVYGQDPIKLRMKKDIIKDKKKAGGMNILVLGAILAGGYFLIKAFFPKLFGG